MHQGVVLGVLDAVDVLLAHYAQLVLASICLGENLTIVLVAVGLYLLCRHLHQVVDLLTDWRKLLHVLLRQRVEVVIDMLLDRIEHTTKRVDELLVAVGAEVEPGVALDGNLHWRTFQSEHLLATELLQHVLLLLQLLVGVAQVASVLVGKTIHDEVELREGEVAHVALGARYLAAKQLPYYLWVARTHHELEGAAPAHFLLFLVVLDVAADEHEDDEGDEGTLNYDASEVHGETYHGTSEECHTSGDKPSTDHAQYTRNTEHGALTAPSTVGKRRTHCHHEGDVGGGERQLEVGTDGDEHGCQHEVDGCTNYVEGGTLLQLHIVLVESAIDPVLQVLRQEVVEPRVGVLAVAYDDTSGRRTTKHLVALVLAAQIHGSLDHVLSLLGGSHGDNHHEASDEQEHGSGLGTLHQ